MEQLAELARTGGPGWVVAFLAFTAVVYLFRQLSKEREMCANDWRTTVAGNSAVMKEFSLSIRTLDQNVRALELIATNTAQLSLSIDQLRDVIHARTEEAIQSNRQMREALLKKRVDL
jgi:hypothetical protein